MAWFLPLAVSASQPAEKGGASPSFGAIAVEDWAANPEVYLARRLAGSPFQRLQSENQFAERYQNAVMINPETFVAQRYNQDPHLRTYSELQFAEGYTGSVFIAGVMVNPEVLVARKYHHNPYKNHTFVVFLL